MSSSGLLEPIDETYSELSAEEPSAIRKPARPSLGVHLLLLATTLFTTTALGMRYMYNFQMTRPPLNTDEDIFPYRWIFHNLHMLPAGLPFSLTLLSILLAHEFGHYFACKAVGVRSSLPYVLPAPTLSGTAGAIIRLRSRIKSRTGLILIGASGPIAGFVVALVTTWIGLANSKPEPENPVSSSMQFTAPLTIEWMHTLLRSGNPAMPNLYHIVPHPMVVASWIGLLVTSVNLIPAGQLDGGHILYAISPKAHKLGTQIVTIALVFIGTIYWIGWLLWALVLMMPMMKHPDVPVEDGLKAWQIAMAVVCVAIFVLSFCVQPFAHASLMWEIGRIRWGI